MTKNNYSVYIHVNKTNGKTYVGLTRQKPERRWQKGHGYDGTYFGKAIKKYGWDNFVHIVFAVGLSKEDAQKTEIDTIRKLRSNDRTMGYNISKGGDTTDNFNPRYGINHPNHKRVKMIDPKTNEVLRIFDSQSDASRIMGIDRRGITKGCQGINKTYKGYIWEYADIDYKKPEHKGAGNYPHTKLCKRVKMTDVDGKVYIFDSQKQAGEVLGIKRNMISQYINGYCVDKSGRGWCHA